MAVIKRNRWAITLAIFVIASFLGLGSVAVRRAQALPNDTYQELETFANVLAIAGLDNISSQVLDTLTTGNIIETSVAPNTHMEWMALKRSGTPGLLRNVRWVGQQPFEVFQFNVDYAGYSYTFVVPKVCGNLALVSRTAMPVVRHEEPPAPAPAPPPPQRWRGS